MRFLSGQEIKSALNSGNVCALSKKRRAMENAVEALQGRISAQEGSCRFTSEFRCTAVGK